MVRPFSWPFAERKPSPPLPFTSAACVKSSNTAALIQPPARAESIDVAEVPPTYEDAAPPGYSPLDDQVLNYHLSAPVVSTGESIRYQLKLERTGKGRPFRICIRRLLPSESRRLSQTTSSAGSRSLSVGSVASANNSNGSSRLSDLDFDRESTMYMITKLSLLGVGRNAPLEIKGCRASTVPGHIHLLREGRGWRFYHLKRNPANDALRPENRRKMEKYGYRPEDEWTRTVMFTASSGGKRTAEWRDGDERLVATEGDDGFLFRRVMDPKLRDLLVTCWIGRTWLANTLRWEHEGLGA